MELSKEQLEKIKVLELKILQAFIIACDKLNIDYFLAYGTALGAARHRGFIPWDDDIDVYLLRKDYELFMKRGQEYLPKEYFLQNENTDKNYPMDYAKIRDERTVFEETTSADIVMHKGLFVDIFPLDYVPDGKIRKKILNLKLKWNIFKRDKIFDYSNYRVVEQNKIKKFIKSILNIFIRKNQKTCNKARDKIIALSKQVKESNFLTNYTEGIIDKYIYSVEMFNSTDMLDFENIQVKVCNDIDRYLKQTYGNYMELPKEEDRIPHHYISRLEIE